jgi:AcrR family transcriptional regulator
MSSLDDPFEPASHFERVRGYANGAAARASGERDPAPPPLWQRERLLAAMIDEVAAKGYTGTSVASVTARAGVTPAVFEANFADKENCFLEAFDSLLRQLVAHTISAYYAPRESWTERARAGLCMCIGAVCTRAEAARAYLNEAPAISAATRAHRAQAIAMFEDAITEMLLDVPAAAELSPVTVVGITGGMWRVIEDRLRAGRAAELPAMVEALLAWALAYLPGARHEQGVHGRDARERDAHRRDARERDTRERDAREQDALVSELIAGAISEIAEREGPEDAREFALALSPVLNP